MLGSKDLLINPTMICFSCDFCSVQMKVKIVIKNIASYPNPYEMKQYQSLESLQMVHTLEAQSKCKMLHFDPHPTNIYDLAKWQENLYHFGV